MVQTFKKTSTKYINLHNKKLRSSLNIRLGNIFNLTHQETHLFTTFIFINLEHYVETLLMVSLFLLMVFHPKQETL